MTAFPQLLRTAALTIAWLVVLPCALLLLSALIPVLPWVRIYAFDVVPNHVSWLFLVSVVTLGVGILAHCRRRTPVTIALLAVTAVATTAASIVIGSFLSLAVRNHIPVNLLASLSTRHYSEDAAPDVTRVYAVRDGEPLSLDVYRPPAALRGHPGPVLVVVHGGGFVGGSRSIGAANMRRHATNGWTVISIDYRLARPGRPTWNLAVDDVRCALAWIDAHGTALRVDLDRLALSGASAGGSLAMAAAYTLRDARPDPRCGSRFPPIAAVIAKVPLIDPAASWDNPGELMEQQRSYMHAYFGGSPRNFPSRYARQNLRQLLRANNPPTLIMSGENDPLLPIASVERFSQRAMTIGAPVTLMVFPYSGHDFNTTYDGLTNQITTRLVTDFLANRNLGSKGG